MPLSDQVPFSAILGNSPIKKWNPELLISFLDFVPIIILILDSERNAVYANARLLNLAGASSMDEIPGRPPGEIFACRHLKGGGKCGATEFCPYCGANNTIANSLMGKTDSQECKIVRDSKAKPETLELQVWTHPFTAGDTPFIFVSILDISDIKRRQNLERIFFHDIMNSAGSIYSIAEMLVDDIAPDPKAYLTHIHNAAISLVDEIQSQKDMVDAENDDLTLSLQPINSEGYLEKILSKILGIRVFKDRRVVISPGSQDFTFNGDSGIVGRIICNLLKNTLEATREDEIVTLGIHRAGECIETWVHGPNFIPKQVQLQMFNRYFTTKGKNRGLGLYSVRLLTERYLKGTVNFTSSVKDGTTFTVRWRD